MTPGIPAELQSRVFDRFFRGDASHNNEVEGCGLGLSIAQWVAAAHRGEIRLVSEPGQGHHGERQASVPESLSSERWCNQVKPEAAMLDGLTKKQTNHTKVGTKGGASHLMPGEMIK